jgi:uncharacterized membrane protein
MNGNQGLFGQMMRRGVFGDSSRMHDAGTSSLEWAILGIVIAILVVVLLLLVDRCRHRRLHRQRGWGHHGALDDPSAIAGARYARGELKRDEYLQLLDDLGAPPGENDAPPENAAAEIKPRRRRGRQPKAS